MCRVQTFTNSKNAVPNITANLPLELNPYNLGYELYKVATNLHRMSVKAMQSLKQTIS